MTESTVLSARGLSKSYGGVQALHDIDFEVGVGEIRCLAGENGSGKSTFVKILSGVTVADHGTITVAGEEMAGLNPRDASAAGIQVIYQDLSLFGHLSVAENIAINRMMHDGSPFVNRSTMHNIAVQQLRRVGVDLPLDAPVASLSVANRQIVAICRALAMDARILFMDEPTTALTGKEVERLLAIIRDLKDRGLSTVFISHKLDEVFAVADSITIFRDGAKVGDFAASELDQLSLSRHMTGRDVIYKPYMRRQKDENPILEVSGLTRKGNYENVDLTIRPGDIVGLTGLLGSGRTELALSLFGLNKPDSGSISMNGSRVSITAPWVAMKHGIALLPEERLSQGLFPTQSVEVNASATMLDRIVNKVGLLSRSRERDLAQTMVRELNVNNRDTSTPILHLSGGNQQKVAIGKWISRSPSIFILDSPTVGIDIGSKAEIYEQIHQLAESGMGVLFISDEPEEIAANCNRVVVMHAGVLEARFSEEEVAAAGFKEQLVHAISTPSHADGAVASRDAVPTEVASEAKGPSNDA
jgi:simple sugar transport system ATP-binding protein